MTEIQYALTRIPARLVLSRRGGLVAVAYALAVTMVGTTLPTPLYGLYRSAFGFSELMVTVVFAVYAAGVIATLLVAGRLSDEVGRRPVLLSGLVFAALGAVSFLFAHGLGLLLAGRVLSGLSAGIFTGTATATLLDLAPAGNRGRATLVASGASIGGLGLGALLAGLLSQFLTAPLHLVFWVELGLLVPAVALVWAAPEPVARSGSFRPRLQRLSVPAGMGATFARSALAAFAGFAVLGLFTAVVPGFLGQILAIDDRATVGLVVFAVFVASAAGQVVLERVLGRAALLAGSGGLVAGMALLALGLAASSLALVVAGGVVAGLGQGVSFRASLAAVNEAAPAARRAEVASSFFVVAYLAISLPVVGLGLLAQVAGLRAAGLIFAALVAALATAVLAFERRSATQPQEGETR